MRSIYFISTTLFFLSLATLTQAQTNVYVPFPDSGAQWNGEYSICTNCEIDPFNPISYYFGFYFRETHDTVINTLTYHLINLANTWIIMGRGLNLGPPFSEQTVGAIREDSLRRIYYRCFQEINYCPSYINEFNYYDSLPKDTDILLYDFGLNVGDTTTAQLYRASTTFVVGYDSVLIGNTYRKALKVEDTLDGTYAWDEWVEGIGSINYGLLGSTYLINIIADTDPFSTPSLTCFSINNQVLYPQDQEGSCDTIVIADINTPSTQKPSLQIFPNPASDELFLKFSQNFTPTTITIYNSIGQQINLPFNPSINNSLNVEILSAGLYIIKASNNTTVLTDMFIKE